MRAQKYTDLPVAILCGGLGTRLGELTRNTPKCMIDINGRPFVSHQLDLLFGKGFSRIVLCAGHLSSQLVSLPEPVLFSFDEPGLSGTGTAVKHALPLLGNEFFVTYGDSYLPIDYEPIFEAHRSGGNPITVSRWHGVDYGMNIFTPEVFENYSGSFSLNQVINGNPKTNWNSPHGFHEIGSPAGLEEVRRLLK